MSDEREIVRRGWALKTYTQPNNTYTWDQIQVLSVVASFQVLEEISETLKSIRRDILMLGSDGLHEILQYERARIRKTKRLRQARINAKRRKTLAAKKAAQQG